ncbi:MAG: VOC family protein [Blastomonas sp.]
MAALSYCTLPTSDVAKARAFYDPLLAGIGWGVVMEIPGRGVLYGDGISMIGLFTPYDGEPASTGNGAMFGIKFDSTDDAAAFHAKALELGGTCEGAPGERSPGAFFAYFRDPQGNKLCAYKLG